MYLRPGAVIDLSWEFEFVDSKHPAPTVAILQGEKDPVCLVNNRCKALFSTDSYSGTQDYLVQGSHLGSSSQFRIVVFHKKLRSTLSPEISGTVTIFAQTPTFGLNSLTKCENSLPSDDDPEQPPEDDEFVISIASTSFLCRIEISREAYRKSEPGLILVAPSSASERSHGVFVRTVRNKPWEPIQDLIFGLFLSIFVYVVAIIIAPLLWTLSSYFINGGDGLMDSMATAVKAPFEWVTEKFSKKYEPIEEDPTAA
ncbi:hypothetical protein HK096_002621 [Nowakowskiella sp. JEL0078]|nr:hypothetical protein HK096_002621 [Nowakowskiella sp. JEL0078]